MKTPFVYPSAKVAQVAWDPATGAITADTQLPSWVQNTKLVAKPDQLIKRRGKAGLLCLNKDWEEAKQWIIQRAGKPQKVSWCISLDVGAGGAPRGTIRLALADPICSGVHDLYFHFIYLRRARPATHDAPRTSMVLSLH